MATISQIPLNEYLGMNYRPDREYVDGEIRERNVGKYEHARIQALLARWFGNHEQEWGVQPDVIFEPPLLVVEILSPDDSYSDTQERAQDYRAMGVETVWIIDPKTRSGRMCCGAEWIEASRLEVRGTPLYVNLPDIFSQLTTA
jgi:hypothetical protein